MMRTKRTSDRIDLKCVVADDVRAIREQLAAWLGQAGFSVIHAGCGATALRAIRREIPHLVVTDIDMPHVSGLHLLQTLRRDPDLNIAAVPVIVASSLEDHEVNRMVCTLGGSAFLKKPIDRPRFMTCIQAMVAGVNAELETSGVPNQVSSRFRGIVANLDV